MALTNYIRALGKEGYNHYVYSLNDGPLRKIIEDSKVPVQLGPKRSSIKNPIKFGASLFSLSRDLLKFLRIIWLNNQNTIHRLLIFRDL